MLFLPLLPQRTPSSPHAPGSGSNSLHCVMHSAHLGPELCLCLLTECLRRCGGGVFRAGFRNETPFLPSAAVTNDHKRSDLRLTRLLCYVCGGQKFSMDVTELLGRCSGLRSFWTLWGRICCLVFYSFQMPPPFPGLWLAVTSL